MCQCGVNLLFGLQYLCLPVAPHLVHEITQICTQICIIMGPDFFLTCRSVVRDPPLNDNFIMQQLRVMFHIL